MQCKKCSNPGSITLRKRDFYCDTCFVASTNHKFRACLGKNKILSKNEKVLVCLSGCLGSTVLLNLINNGIAMDSHKKLRIDPIFLHLIDVDNNGEMVINQCKQYNYDVYLVHMYQYMEPDLELPLANIIPPVQVALKEKFDSLMKSLPSTTYTDFKLKIQRNLFSKCAEKLHCNFIFTGETTTTLAINLLSNLALGRGSQVEHDVGFCDSRNLKIKILKPMKEITHEELQCYAKLKNLNHCSNNKIHNKTNSLQSVIGEFVTDLQDNFAATISTVCKTADKIGLHEKTESGDKCVICESDLGESENIKLNALEATKFSRTVSLNKPKVKDDFSKNIYSEEIEADQSHSLFPHIHKNLCYCCSKNYSEVQKDTIPSHLLNLLDK